MSKTTIIFVLLFLLLILAQVVVFNHIWLFGVAIPIIFIYFIISLPESLGTGWAITFAFLAGFLVDIFSNTPGLNAMCCTVCGAVKRPMLKLYVSHDEEMTNSLPSPYTLGGITYMKYLITFTTLYSLLYFVILSMDFFNFYRLVIRIISTSLLSFIIILALSYLFNPSPSKKK